MFVCDKRSVRSLISDIVVRRMARVKVGKDLASFFLLFPNGDLLLLKTQIASDTGMVILSGYGQIKPQTKHAFLTMCAARGVQFEVSSNASVLTKILNFVFPTKQHDSKMLVAHFESIDGRELLAATDVEALQL